MGIIGVWCGGNRVVANTKRLTDGSPLWATIRLGWPPACSRREVLGERDYPSTLIYTTFYI